MQRSDPHTAEAGSNWAWRTLDRLGASVIDWCRMVVYLASMMWAVAALAIQPRHWRRTTREMFARQLLRIGVHTIAPVGLVAFLVGIVVVMQAQLWLGKMGQTDWLGPFLVVVVVRELAPLLTNLIMILRNGSEMTVELAGMTVTGKTRMLDAQGIDPLTYLVMPRVAATVVSTFCLVILFILFSFVSGYLFSFTLGLRVAAPGIFLNQVLRALRSEDVLKLLVTGLVPPLLTAAVCCSEGLNAPVTSTAVPLVTRRALSHSVVGLFLISVPASVLTYL